MIPDFISIDDYPNRVLPDGVHECDESEFEENFVKGFPNSRTRKSICDGFFWLRDEVEEIDIPAVQWVDGSYVESKIDPNDIDVVSFCDCDRLNSLSRDTLLQLLDGRNEKNL